MSKKIEKRVNQTFTNATPDMSRGVIADCQSTTVYRQAPAKKNSFNFWKFATFALALVLMVTGIIGGVQLGQTAQAATVTLDVNPSIDIEINGKNRVKSVTANNDDAKEILQPLKLEGCDLETAIYAIIGSMATKGYLNELANSVLVSVDTSKEKVFNDIVDLVTNQINLTMKEHNIESSVVAQWIKNNDSARTLAEKHDISVGKAQLIQKILSANSQNTDGTVTYTEAQLVELTVNELSLILANLKIDDLNQSGTASGKAYIGQDNALSIALAKLGVELSAESILAKKIRLDFDDGIMVYEVEFIYNGCLYEFEVGATSGKVLSMEMNADFDIFDLDEEPISDQDIIAKALESAGVTAEQVVTEDGPQIEDYSMFGVKVVYFETATHYYELELTLGGTVIYKSVISLEEVTDAYLSRSQAQELILKEAQLTTLDNVKQFRLHKLVKDIDVADENGDIITQARLVYEFSFIYEGVKYSGTLDAVDGSIAMTEVTEADKETIAKDFFGEDHHGEWDEEEWEYEFCEGGYRYEFEFDKWGNLISQSKERDDDYQPEIAEGETIPTDKLNEVKNTIAYYFGCKPSDIEIIAVDVEKEHGVSFYEVEFTIDGIELEIKINAVTGTIINDYDFGGYGHGNGWYW